ncbi:MAG: DHA2 family efflux MFS transporter permease subunit [Bacteroidota bacterium]|jgi:DHA2 family multidrug resistance protein
MSEAAEGSVHLTPLRRVLILLSVILATTLYGTTLLVVSTILPQMQGSFSATADEIAWSMTFNILATAIVTPATGWLAARFGTRSVMVGSMTGFTIATLMCAISESLEGLIFWRVAQGAFGAPTTPLAQSILLESFPRSRHALVLGLYGFGVVIGPVIGPSLGGLMAELYTWRWAFYCLVPVGVLSIIGLRAALPPDSPRDRIALDWTGFLTLSIALAAMQLALSRGQRLDWFESGEIITETAVAVLAFWVFVVHCLTAKKPFLNPRQLLNRNYSIGLLLVTIYGMLNFTPMVLLPPLLTTYVGYPDSLVGLVVAGRGLGGCVGFLLAGFANRMEPRLSMSIGFGMLLAAGLWLMRIDLNVTAADLMANAVLQGLAIGLIWVPLTTVSFATVSKEDMAEATAVYHLLRNLGSSFFISICVAEIVRSTSGNYGRMVEFISPFNKWLGLPQSTGAWNVESIRGLAALSREITRQSAMIGYLNAFGLFTAACAATLPLVLLMKAGRPAPPAP